MKPTICLAMIVRNESTVIRRCLESVRPLIDRWVIVDTGSIDDTREVIHACLTDVPGELHDRVWRDFAQNRTEVLELARGQAEYTFIIDADDLLEIDADFTRAELGADAYTVSIRDSGGVTYARTQLVRSALPWRYRGVLHEFIECTSGAARPAERLPGVTMIRSHDGARRRDPTTYARDAAILARALEVETDPFMLARYTFYLAQSYRDAGEKQKAIEFYLARASQGHWTEEVYISLLQAGRLREQLGEPIDAVLSLYAQASATVPRRAEALQAASRLLRLAGKNKEGFAIAAQGINLPRPEGLFIEPWVYDYGLRDEYAINAYWAGHIAESLAACLEILDTDVPDDVYERVRKNLDFCVRALPRGVPRGERPTTRFHAVATPGDHAARPSRELHSRTPRTPRTPHPHAATPRVLIAILAKQQEPMLPLYLRCIEALEYPTASICLYIRTNNNTDLTSAILRAWIERVGHRYASVDLDDSDVDEAVQRFEVHEWNAERFKVLARIRETSLARALELDCSFYFTADVDNFIRPSTLRELIALDLPIVAPLLRAVDPSSRYSNFHADIAENGYYVESDRYTWILDQRITGVFELPVVHCTYLIRADVIPLVTYTDDSSRHEYVVFSESARRAGVPQYYDNRQLYGYLTLDPTAASAARAAELMAPVLPAELELAAS